MVGLECYPCCSFKLRLKSAEISGAIYTYTQFFTTRACHPQTCEQNYYFIRNNEEIKASNLCKLQYSVKFQVPSAMAVRSIAVWYVTPCRTERH